MAAPSMQYRCLLINGVSTRKDQHDRPQQSFFSTEEQARVWAAAILDSVDKSKHPSAEVLIFHTVETLVRAININDQQTIQGT